MKLLLLSGYKGLSSESDVRPGLRQLIFGARNTSTVFVWVCWFTRPVTKNVDSSLFGVVELDIVLDGDGRFKDCS